MSLRLAAIVALSTLLSISPLSAQEIAAKPAGLPVKRVVMFSSGVAYYERQGEVQDNATLDLQFNVRDINDLLKSMVLRDLGGGQISTISYESNKPLEKTLQTFAIDLTANPTLADLLEQVRGEKIEIDAPTKVIGTILGVERREVSPAKGQTTKVAYLNLLTDEGLRSLSLENVGRIKLLNPKLDAELRQALIVLATNNSVDKKSVKLNFLGQGKRQVRVGYVQESPIWKTSYRLVLSDEKPTLLQGWAIIENTTEEDWEGVNLSLISGRPVSFQMDLYQPLFVERPQVALELYSSLRPQKYDQDLAKSEQEFLGAALDAAPKAFEKQLAAEPSADRRQAANQNRFLSRDEKAGSAAFAPGQAVQSVAQAADVGEMFQYQIATPVKLDRQQSAMLPIVNDSVTGEKLAIYNPAVHAKHPLHGLRLKNTTDLHLMQGPVTVFDDGTYAGDAQLSDLPPKSERLISYAMDLDTEVAVTAENPPNQLVAVKLLRGTLVVTRRYQRDRTYTAKNSGKQAKKVLIEYPIDSEWKLVEPQEPAEKTRDLYRFALTAEPGKPATQKIAEARTADENYAVTNLDSESMAFYIRAKEVPQKIKDVLTEILKLKQNLATATAELNELNRQVEVIFAEQARVRQNMTQVPKDSELFRRYLTKFGEQEGQVEKLRADVQQKISQRDTAQQKLNAFLQSLELS